MIIAIVVIVGIIAVLLLFNQSGTFAQQSSHDVKPTGIIKKYIDIANQIPGASRPDRDINDKPIAHEYVCNVAGVKRPFLGADPQMIIPTLHPYERLAFVPCENNNYEPHAVEVVTLDGCHVGWYPSDGERHDAIYRRLLDNDFIFVMVSKTGQIEDAKIWWCEIKIVYYATDYDPGKSQRKAPRPATDAELTALDCIKATLADAVPADDIGYKTTEKYLSIFYKNNSRKWICRLYIYETPQRIVIPDADGNTSEYDIQSLEEISELKNLLLRVVERFDKALVKKEVSP